MTTFWYIFMSITCMNTSSWDLKVPFHMAALRSDDTSFMRRETTIWWIQTSEYANDKLNFMTLMKYIYNTNAIILHNFTYRIYIENYNKFQILGNRSHYFNIKLNQGILILILKHEREYFFVWNNFNNTHNWWVCCCK